MLIGSCLCGAINYQVAIDSHVEHIIFCHCKRCRKWSGSAFNAVTMVKKSDFALLTGQNDIKTLSKDGVNRHFCSMCGSNLFTSRDNDDSTYRLRIGCIDSPIYPKQKIHIYTDSKANWDQICDGGIEYSDNIK